MGRYAYEAIAEFLSKEDIQAVFTLMSEEIIPLISELQRQDDIHIIDTRHEQGAASMADGYHRTSGKIAVCITGRGPAIAQTGTSLVTARKNGSNILYLVPTPARGNVYDGKRFEQTEYLQSVVREVEFIETKDSLIQGLTNAFRRLRVGIGPIAMQIPTDILNGVVDQPSHTDLRNPVSYEPQIPRVKPDSEKLEDVIELYLDSDATKPPVVIAGRGAVKANAKPAIERLAEKMNALLATTIRAQGYFSDHPFSLGFVGDLGNHYANERMVGSDFILAIGCSLNPHTVDSERLIGEGAKIAHIDDEASNIDRYTQVDVGVVGDARLATELLHEELERLGLDREGKFWTDTERRRIDGKTRIIDRDVTVAEGTVHPRKVVATLNDRVPSRRMVVADIGHFSAWIHDGMTIPHPDDFIWPIDFVSIGQGLPIGIGAALAAEDKTTVTFCGDAGLMMSLQELETAIRHSIPLIVVVMNDGALGAEYHHASHRGYPVDATLTGSPDFADVAESFGGVGYTVRSNEELNDAIGNAFDALTGPVILDCKIDKDIKHTSMDVIS